MKCLISAMIRTLDRVKIRMELLWFSAESVCDSDPGSESIFCKISYQSTILVLSHLMSLAHDTSGTSIFLMSY